MVYFVAVSRRNIQGLSIRYGFSTATAKEITEFIEVNTDPDIAAYMEQANSDRGSLFRFELGRLQEFNTMNNQYYDHSAVQCSPSQ